MPNQQTASPNAKPVRSAEQDHVLQELLKRSIRTESRVVQMMAHMGMKGDGRSNLQPTRNPL